MKTPSQFSHGGRRRHTGRPVKTLHGFLKGLSASERERVQQELRSMVWGEIRELVLEVIANLERSHGQNRDAALVPDRRVFWKTPEGEDQPERTCVGILNSPQRRATFSE